ncbi:unnamed protein product [Ranitomeya imitator]|uniref:RRM domain-containing protein n=1 Tax=Ranitomeya imitator TaxID=111125 RepID=A0ABN9LM78_9NEOB|nr:unnamed protein product [Ranitomeya imitator]
MRDAIKIFVGNVDDRTTQEELTELFQKYGAVVSCAVMKQYAFVHMRALDSATKAIEELNGRELHGKKLVVELSKPRPQNTWKIFIGNVGSDCEASTLRALFETYGKVVECDVVKGRVFRISLSFSHTKRLTNDHDQRYDLAVIVVQAAGSGAKDGMREGPAMTSRSCDCDVITVTECGKQTARDLTDTRMFAYATQTCGDVAVNMTVTSLEGRLVAQHLWNRTAAACSAEEIGTSVGYLIKSAAGEPAGQDTKCECGLRYRHTKSDAAAIPTTIVDRCSVAGELSH